MSHLIGKLTLDLHCTGKARESLELQKQTTRFCNETLLPALEQLFDRMAERGVQLRLDNINVEANGQIDLGDQEALLRLILEAITQTIDKQRFEPTDPQNLTLQPVAVAAFEKWIYFLQHGYLPLQGSSDTETLLWEKTLERVAGHLESVEILRNVLLRDPQALNRLVKQHPESFLQHLAESFLGSSLSETISLRQILEQTIRQVAQKAAAPTPKLKKTTAKEKADSQNRPPDPSLFPAALRAGLNALLSSFKNRYWAIVWEHITQKNRLPQAATLLQQILAKHLSPEQEIALLRTVLEDPLNPPPTLLLSTFDLVLQKRLSAFPAPAAKQVTQQDAIDKPVLDKAALLSKPEPPSETTLGIDISPKTGDNSLENKKSTTPDSQQTNEQTAFSPKTGDKPLENKKSQTPDSQQTTNEKAPPDPSYPNRNNLEGEKSGTKEPGPAYRPSKTGPDAAQHWYIQGAGMVLLHPFLPILFKTLKLTEGKDFRDLECRQTGIYLLHYLTFGVEEAPEFDLTLPKFLCQWPQNEALDRNKGFSEDIKTECDQLLQAVIRHWAKLGTVTPEGLQQGFLSRPGKLVYNPPDGWRLQVEQSGIDILLNSIPWGFGMVKLPWMDGFLSVEWPY